MVVYVDGCMVLNCICSYAANFYIAEKRD